MQFEPTRLGSGRRKVTDRARSNAWAAFEFQSASVAISTRACRAVTLDWPEVGPQQPDSQTVEA